MIAYLFNLFCFSFSFEEDPIICVKKCYSCPRIPTSPVPAGFSYEEINGKISKSRCASFICCHCIPCCSYSQEHKTSTMQGALNFYCCASCNYLEENNHRNEKIKTYDECCFLCCYAYEADAEFSTTYHTSCACMGASCSYGEENGCGFNILGIGCFLGNLKKAITCCLYEY